MKNIKFNYLSLGMLLIFAACSEDTDRIIYNANPAEVGFETKSATILVEDGVADTYELILYRAKHDGDLTINLQIEDEDELFTIPASVNFPAGVASQKIEISYDRTKLITGAPSILSITVPEITEIDASSRNLTFELSVLDDFEMEPFGIASFESEMYGEYEVEMLKAINTEVEAYRLVDLFVDGVDFTFIVEEDDHITLPGKAKNGVYTFVTGEVHSGSNMITLDLDPAASYFDRENKIAKFYVKYYVPNVGSWGDFVDILTW